MRVALVDLELEGAFVVYPRGRRYRLGQRAEALPLRELPSPRILL